MSESQRPDPTSNVVDLHARVDRLAAEVAEETDHQEVPSPRLLGFYDRLRGRIERFLERRGHRLGKGAADALLLVPDVFVLLLRLALDRETPSSARTVIGGALAYFVLPADLLPEALLGPGGFVEDLVVAAAALSFALSEELEPRAIRYWSGSQGLRATLSDVLRTAQSLLGEDLYGRLVRLLARRGIPMEST